MGWIVKGTNWICENREVLITQDSLPDPISSNDKKITISGSVGIHGYNYPEDVVRIQEALNQAPTEKGGPSPPLKHNTNCDPKTKNAIQIFQLEHFGWSGADGLIEPGKQTLARLNEILGKTKGPTENKELVTTSAIQFALSMVAAAKFKLLSASPVLEFRNSSIGGIPAFNRESLMYLLNKHFSFDSSNNRRRSFNVVMNKYDRMTQVFQRPGSIWGKAVFERDPINYGGFAYARGGGYFLPGQAIYKNGTKMRLDSIFLCKKFFKELDCLKQAFVIVHELAHFVGQYNEIADYAYNREGNGAKVRNLSPELKILNAECYANFAYEARTGQEPWGLR